MYALAEAAYAYERALDLWDAVPADDRPQDIDVVQILYEAALALIGSGQLLRARDVAGQAVERFDPGDRPAAGRARARAGMPARCGSPAS